MRKKIFYCLLGLIFGIGIFINFEYLNLFKIFIGCAIISIICVLIDKKLLIFSVAIFMGFSLASINFSSYKLKDIPFAKAHVTVLEKRQSGDKYRYFARVKTKDIDERSVFFTEDDLSIGQSYLADIDITIPAKNTNPNLFNYRAYLLSKGIASSIKITDIYKAGYSKSNLLAIKNNFYTYVHLIFEENMTYLGSDFIISVILGENLIENNDLRDLGIAHILAISGLHIDLLIALVLLLFNKLNLSYKHGYIIALGLSFFYGYLIGFPFSIMRVIFINGVGFLAFLLGKPNDRLKSLLMAALLILFINPFAILNAGYVLTFVATSAVYLIYPKIRLRFTNNFIKDNMSFTGAIQLGLIPFTIYYNGNFNLMSLVANFLILPIFTLCMYLSFIIMILFPLFKAFLGPLFKILDYLLVSIINVSVFLNKFKFMQINFAHPSIILAVYFYALILCIFYIRRPNKKLLRYFYLSNLLVLAMPLAYRSLKPELSFSMIDIGQGDAFLLNDGGDYYLFDVGGPKYEGFDSGEEVLVAYLKSMGIDKVRAVFISHEDKDHSGNLEILKENIKVDNIITTKANIKSLAAYKPAIMKVNDRYKLKNGSITCVYDADHGDENSQSMGLMINLKGIKILTLGDLPKQYEDTLDVNCDVLKVSHHGSKTSTSKEFIARVKPKVALISAGRNNTYGHPSKEVLENLQGIKIYNTQDDGMVKIIIDDKVKVSKYLKGGYFR